MKPTSILHGVSVRALLFVSSYLSVPVLLNQMGLNNYAAYIYVAGLVNIAGFFEFGNSNNLVEIGANRNLIRNPNPILKFYLKKAKVFAFLAVLISALFLSLDSILDLNPKGIHLNSDMRIAIIAGVTGMGLTFVANVYSKFRIAGKYYKSIMTVTALTNLITTISVILAAHFQKTIWLCILLQFSLQPILTILILKNKFPNRSTNSNYEDFSPQQNRSLAPHFIFKFYSLFTPIYGNLIIILFSRQPDKHVFTSASIIYRITSIPLIFISFAWLGNLWVEISNISENFNTLQIKKSIARKIMKSTLIVLPFFCLTALYGANLVSIWTNYRLVVNESIVLNCSILGLIQFMGVIPGAVTLVYRKTSFIITTHSIFLISLYVAFKVFSLSENPDLIVKVLILTEICTILLPNYWWIFFRLQPRLVSKLETVKNV